MILKFILLLLVIVCICYPYKEGYVGFNNLMDNFMNIFPDGNRNSGGVQFFKHIHDMKDMITKEEYMKLHTYYCAVSGSPIDPKRNNRFNHIRVTHIDGRIFIGKYYRCCTPCLADIMKYTKVEHHNVVLKDGPHEYLVLTIKDPCINEREIPRDVSSFQCSNGETINGIKSESGRLIIGVLHDHEEYISSKHDKLLEYSLEISEERMNTDPDNLRGGMGDIFVKLSLINKS